MPLKIAITGSTGLIGSVLRETFVKEGHAITAIIRPTTHLKFNQKVIRWNPETNRLEKSALEGYDGIIHLSGANIADGYWTDKYKKVILESRARGTNLLASAIAQLKKPPRLFLCACAVGYYGVDSLSEVKDELSAKGKGFLADVCETWEKAANPARQAGVRTVSLRLGMVLDKKGGALAKMLPIFKLGLGGRLASGNQPMSWIASEEIPRVVLHILGHEDISGAVNGVAPQVVSNTEFTKALAQIIHRPAVFPVPAFALQLLFGEMADSLLLGGQNVAPRKLLESGYQFQYPTLQTALQHIFSQKR